MLAPEPEADCGAAAAYFEGEARPPATPPPAAQAVREAQTMVAKVEVRPALGDATLPLHAALSHSGLSIQSGAARRELTVSTVATVGLAGAARARTCGRRGGRAPPGR